MPDSDTGAPARVWRAASPLRSTHGERLRSSILRQRLSLLVVSILLGSALWAIFAWVRGSVERNVKAQLATQLRVTLDAAAAGAVSELEAAERSARAASADRELRAVLQRCLSSKPSCDETHDASAWQALQSKLNRPLAVGHFARVRCASSDGASQLSVPADAQARALTRRELDLAQRQSVPTILWPDAAREDAPISFVAGLGPQAGTALAFDLPISWWSRILRAARAGQSGETYAFDAHGRLLSESRFTGSLRQLGLIERDLESAVLALNLRDPGGDLTKGFRAERVQSALPYTKAVASALAGGSGYDVDGYRDYRGVLVVGSWRWLPRLRIGVVTEVDAAEAFETLNELDTIFRWLFAALLLASLAVLAALAVSAHLSRRVERAELTLERLGQYELKRKLGEGAMGTVYLAEHALLRRPAAIKLLRKDRTSAEDRSRFEREIKVTATLSHANTVAVYDHGVNDDGTMYCVMEYLDGMTLEQMVDGFGPIASARVVHLLRQLCGALSEAHAAGLVHRDLKPANLMVCAPGGVADTLKVLDFGLSKPLRVCTAGLTETKIVLGTPHYMAPELFESSSQASVQSDLYAVGAVGYFLLTGCTVFDEETVDGICMAHLTHTPLPPSRRVATPIDPQLEAALLACLAKNRDARPRNASALLALMERCPCAHGWTSDDAERWWTARQGEVQRLRVTTRP